MISAEEGEANIPGDDMPDMAQMGAGGGGMPPGMMGGMPGMMGGGGGGGGQFPFSLVSSTEPGDSHCVMSAGGLPEGMDMEKLMAQMKFVHSLCC